MTKYWGGLAVVCGLSLAACSAGAGSQVEVSEANPVESQAEALALNALTAAQSKTVLRLIDNICGDTWCDGDYDFGFRRLACSNAGQTCTLTLQAFPVDGVSASQKSYWRSCKTPGFTGFRSLVNTAPSGYQSLTDAYYDVLSECISRVESNLH
ncbi:MAG: hypothetical protein ABI548_12615 [Polyangiaceae bacterium]